ncbi:DUF3857 and transglutaminase domain-containing protein [bacterium]|nr:DUF3857 and transglutaminase domain-containing protein [bacterium]
MHRLLIGMIVLLCAGMFAFAQDSSPYKELIEAAGTAENYEGQDIVCVFDSTMVDVEESGLSHKRVRTLTKVLTPAGVTALQSHRLDYDPASNKIEISIARVHRKDGTIEEIDRTMILDLPQPQHSIYWGARMKLVQVPLLEVGDAVEFESTTVGFMIAYLASDGEEERYIPPMRGTYYDVILFGGDIYSASTPPMKVKSYKVAMPLDKVAQYETYNGEVMASMTFENDKLLYHFWMEDVPAYETEPRAPDASDVVPKVVFTNVKDWAEKSRWFYWANEDSSVLGHSVFESNDAIAEEVRRITSKAKDDTSKIYAILHWVAQNIRYSGISMGEGEGYTLHPGPMIYNDRCGVCKDIAGMCVTMLREAGFKETYPVMTMAGARVERIPADQFNHCVVAVRRPDGSFLMVDPTWSPFNMELWSRAETEQHFVIGSPEGEDLGQIGTFSPEENDFTMTFKTRLDAKGNLTGTVKIQAKSYGDARLRRPYTDAGQDRWENICRTEVTNADPRAELTAVKFGNLWDLYHPFTVEMSFKVDGYARVIGNRMDYEPFSTKLSWAGGYQFNHMTGLNDEERTQPVHCWNPRRITIKETLSLPSGYSIDELPKKRDIGGDEAYTRGEWTKSGSAAEFNQIWRVNHRTFPAKYYDDLKASIDAFTKYDDIALVLKKGGAR